jgi:hypothetical protein
VIRAWNELAGERHFGFGAIGNIPARAIDWWCKRERLDEEAGRITADVLYRLDCDRIERDEAKARLKK